MASNMNKFQQRYLYIWPTIRIIRLTRSHMKVLQTFLLLFTLTICYQTIAQNTPKEDAILGLWETGNGKARIQIKKFQNTYYGQIVWLKEPLNEEGKPKVDKNNPDEAKRTKPLLGYRNLLGFQFKGDNTWEHGTIYDPESGNTYNCKIELTDNNTINIRGFIGVSVFGRTDVWKRLQMK
jgi:uncharacterized protein (DUF2147 family)